jgi:hypothetical protein
MLSFKREKERLTIRGQDTDSIAKSVFILSCLLGFGIAPFIGIFTHSFLYALFFGPVVALALDGLFRYALYLERRFVIDHYKRKLKWTTRFGFSKLEKQFEEIKYIHLDTCEKSKKFNLIPVNNPVIYRLKLIGADNIEYLIMENNDNDKIRSTAQKIAWMMEIPVEDKI